MTANAPAVTVLVSAASQHGATAEIASAVAGELSARGIVTALVPPDEVSTVDGYDAFVIGSGVYAGHWLEPAKELTSRFRESLAEHPVWLFSSGPVGDPAGRFAKAMAKEPADVAAVRSAVGARDHHMFAGKLDRKALRPAQRALLRIFGGLDGDFRDWTQIRHWADEIAAELAGRRAGGNADSRG
jgi:menaquinone-dependent protoporphyrinogen oxidase